MPRKPAASHMSTPACISQVAAVWRSVCGVTLPRAFGPRPASRTEGGQDRASRFLCPAGLAPIESGDETRGRRVSRELRRTRFGQAIPHTSLATRRAFGGAEMSYGARADGEMSGSKRGVFVHGRGRAQP